MRSFRQKLMVFVCLICSVLIWVILLFVQFLLEPMYVAMVGRDLNKEIDSIVEAVELHGLLKQGAPAGVHEFTDEINRAVTPMISEGQCLDISLVNEGLVYIGGLEYIAGCTLHTEPVDSIWSSATERSSKNNMLLLQLRMAAAEEGELALVVAGRNGMRQYVVGRLIPQEGAVLLLSANLERIYQAVKIIQRQIVFVSVVMFSISLLMAWAFSRWFTKPITALSDAAMRMAHGDYSVQVPVTQKDEIGALTRDFNTMAREVNRADAMQKDILANVSHDLRTPLTLIKGYAETIRDLNGNDKEKRDAQLNIIISESDRLSALVGSVMELSRLDAGTEKFAPVTFDISDFCEEISYRYADICQKNGYQLLVESPGERLITADPDMLSRVLHNLLSNAIAHIGEDGTVILRVADLEQGKLQVEVEDHGTGIAQDELNHIFQRYYRARQANGRPGTGLGLSIVRAILITHQFPFGVRSTLGKGSVFWFSAPVAGAGLPPAKPAAASRWKMTKAAPSKGDTGAGSGE